MAAEEWLLIEGPDGDAEPDHDWLATLPPDIAFERMVDLSKLRWRIERDDRELKQEVGLGHYEGRGWRGSYGELIVKGVSRVGDLLCGLEQRRRGLLR